MEIGKNKKIGQHSDDLNISSDKKGVYIPALHKETKDTVELSTTKKQQPQNPMNSIVQGFKNFANNISFGSGKSDSISSDETQPSPEETKKPTKEDVLAMADGLELPGKVKALISEIQIQDNLNILYEILLNPRLYENKELQNYIDLIIRNTESPETATAKLNFMDKFLSDSRLHNNESLQKNLEDILLFRTRTQESTNAKQVVVDKFLSIPEIYENESIQKTLGTIVLNTRTQSQLSLVDKFFSDSRLYENESLKREIGNILKNTVTKEQVDALLYVIDKILSDSNLYENKVLQENLGEYLSYSYSQKTAETRSNVLGQFFSDSKLYENESLQKIFSDIVKGTDTQARLSITNRFFSDSKLYENESLQKNFANILSSTTNQEIAEVKQIIIDRFLSNPEIQENKSIQKILGNIIKTTNSKIQLSIVEKFFSDPNLYENEALQERFCDILNGINSQEQLSIVNKFLSDPKLYENKSLQNNLSKIISKTKTQEEAKSKLILIDKFLSDPKLYENEALQEKFCNILNGIQSQEQLSIANKFFLDPNLYENEGLQEIFENILYVIQTQEKSNIADKFLSNPRLYENEKLQEILDDIIYNTNTKEQKSIVFKFFSDPNLYENEALQEHIKDIIWHTKTQEKLSIADKFFSDPKLYKNKSLARNLGNILSHTGTKEQLSIANKFLSNPILYENETLQKDLGDVIGRTYTQKATEVKLSLIDKFLSNPKLYKNEGLSRNLSNILLNTDTKEQLNIADKFLSDPMLYENKVLQEKLGNIISVSKTPEQLNIVNRFLSDSKLYENESLTENIRNIIYQIRNQEQLNIVNKFLSDPKLYENKSIQKGLSNILYNVNSKEKAIFVQKLLSDVIEGETTMEVALSTLKNYEKVSYEQLQKLKNTIGSELFNKIYNNSSDVVAAASLIGLYGKNNINEISIAEKRNVVKGIINNNVDLFHISNDLKKAFPLIPTNKEEYCTFLPELIKSIGIEVKPLESEQVAKLDLSLDDLSSSIAKLSDEEFNNLSISQSYPKNKFITDTLSIVEGLSPTERQKVYDYFGFELNPNDKAPLGYSITGYPVNINNGAKLAQITDEHTKQVVEKLREKVIEFSENNQIQSNNVDVEKLLNEILESLPELRTCIGRMQHGAHEFDVLQHSLKVMQKIVQNPNYEKLNESDKKIMLLASLLHDITKGEFKNDVLHADESSFDAFYIAKKFNLSKDEQIKLYTLIKSHEWLKYVNKKGISDEERTKRLQSVAFDLQNDNLFEISKIFTEADIKGITKGDGLYDKFGTALETYSQKIEEYIAELQKSKPILPTTKLPKASIVESKITTVNPDCSTNIKGVYKKDGVVYIKYNEVEDWEALGFPEGSTSRGITTTSPINGEEINTGNIKFIAHGLDYENQLINFDAFILPDSDALLSVSYVERPESKYRLFRTQGVLMDVDTKYVHGGGETDAGSGYGKSVEDFKNRYIFGGERQSDRNYISNLIKETLNLNDEEYINFVRENSDKSMVEIEPVETREALIKAFSLINSNKRVGNRSYNEMYVSNPTIQALFAYSPTDLVGEMSKFIDGQPEFMKKHAKENDLLFFVFGD